MDSIDVKRPIMLKVIMTPDFRKQLIDEAKETIKRIDENLKAIEESGVKQIAEIQEKDPDRAHKMKVQMEQDRDRLFQMKAELDWKIKEVENVDDGAELPFRVFEGSVTIKIGDDLLEKMS